MRKAPPTAASGPSRRMMMGTAAGMVAAAFSFLRGPWAFAQAAIRPAELAQFKGAVITRNHPLYLDWHWAMTWYRQKPPRYPQVFVQPVDDDDAIQAVRYAQIANLKITSRSSGHNISLPPLREGAMTVDLSAFQRIKINEADKSVWADAGLFSETLNRALYAKGFSFPSAHTGFVSIGGFLLGGGMGWNMQSWGMASGSILAAEVVLADGRKVIASQTENPEIYWALRGIGPAFFGIVLRYKLRIYPTPHVVKNVYFVPAEKVEAAVAEMVRLAPASNYRSEILGSIGRFDLPGTPEEVQSWNWVGTIMSFGATEQEALDAAKVFNDSAFLQNESVQISRNESLTYLDLYSQLGTDSYSEYRTTEIAFFTNEPGKSLRIVTDMLQSKAVDPRSFGFSVIDCNPTVPEPCCYSYTAPHYISWYLIANTEVERRENEVLGKALRDALAPLITSYYMNEVDFNLFPDAAEKCFSAEKWKKLGELRQKYDPQGRFYNYVGQD